MKLLINKNPVALQKKMKGGQYFLHKVCENNTVSESFIEFVINIHPLALQQTDESRWYPLHTAYRYEQPEPVLMLLINKYPTVLQEKFVDFDYDGLDGVNLLLHLACAHGSSESFIKFLIDSYPQALQVTAARCGQYPLHLACRYQQTESVIRLLVTKYPEAVRLPDNNHKYPLHWACEKIQSVKIIELFFCVRR